LRFVPFPSILTRSLSENSTMAKRQVTYQEATNESLIKYYALVVPCLIAIQAVLWINIQRLPVSMIYFLVVMCFIFLGIVNGIVVIHILQMMRKIPEALIVQDRNMHIIWSIGLVSLISFFGFLCWRIPYLPLNIPISYSVSQAGGLLLGVPENLLVYPFIGAILYSINLLFSNIIYAINKFSAYLLAGSSLILIVFLSIIVYADLLMSHLW